MIYQDPALKNKVKLLGMAIGNEQNQVEAYKKQFNVRYPIVIDPQFVVSKALGIKGTPFFILMTTIGKVLQTYSGPIENVDEVLSQIRQALGKHE